MTIGPDSVGYRIQTKALVFGGDVPTATDYAVASDKTIEIGTSILVEDILKREDVGEYKKVVKGMLEKVIDTMKTSPEDLPVLLVGGGAVLAPEDLKGASKVLKPKWSGVANAIGAAIARVSAVIDTVESTESKTTKVLLEEISLRVIEKAVEGGAIRESVKIVEMETLPLQVCYSALGLKRLSETNSDIVKYIANKTRFIVRAAGDFDLSRVDNDEAAEYQQQDEDAVVESSESERATAQSDGAEKHTTARPDFDIMSYRPTIKGREWIISETDLDWITIGCYILGTGGGGSPYSSMLRLREILRAGGIVRVINPNDLKDDDVVGCGGGSGSPTVGIEKLQGDQFVSQTITPRILANWR